MFNSSTFANSKASRQVAANEFQCHAFEYMRLLIVLAAFTISTHSRMIWGLHWNKMPAPDTHHDWVQIKKAVCDTCIHVTMRK